MQSELIPFTLDVGKGSVLYGNVRRGAGSSALPVVVLLHGFRVHKDWGFYPYICQELAMSGTHVVQFNFSHNGYGESPSTFDGETFAANTVSQELHDAMSIIDAIEHGALVSEHCHWNGSINIVGHSRGAGIALLVALRRRGVQSLVLWSPISAFDRYSARQKAVWRSRGFIAAPASPLGPAFRIDVTYLNDIEKNQEEYSLTNAMNLCEIPVSLIVGRNDVATPPREAYELYESKGNSECSITIVEHCGHTFATAHPFGGSSPALEQALHVTREWLRKSSADKDLVLASKRQRSIQ